MIGPRLRLWRERCGVSLERVALDAGVDPDWLDAVEQEIRPPEPDAWVSDVLTVLFGAPPHVIPGEPRVDR